jgi:flagella basal body P-ring formation protein FlgA
LLWTSKEPQVLPFYVTVEGLLDTGEPTHHLTSPPIVLVTAGQPAKLVVETATLRMTTLVTPLESGVQGQLIRVRNLDTRRVLRAEVVGKGLLEAELGGE